MIGSFKKCFFEENLKNNCKVIIGSLFLSSFTSLSLSLSLSLSHSLSFTRIQHLLLLQNTLTLLPPKRLTYFGDIFGLLCFTTQRWYFWLSQKIILKIFAGFGRCSTDQVNPNAQDLSITYRPKTHKQTHAHTHTHDTTRHVQCNSLNTSFMSLPDETIDKVIRLLNCTTISIFGQYREWVSGNEYEYVCVSKIGLNVLLRNARSQILWQKIR